MRNEKKGSRLSISGVVNFVKKTGRSGDKWWAVALDTKSIHVSVEHVVGVPYS